MINLKMVSYFLSRLASYPPREFCGVVQYLHSVDREEVSLGDLEPGFCMEIQNIFNKKN